MKPVYQKIIDGVRGDCLSACIASILERDDVPSFLADAVDRGNMPSYHKEMLKWCANIGYNFMTLQWKQLHDWRGLEGMYHIATVPSQIFNGGLHAVVGCWKLYDNRDYESGCKKWYIAHDPNPNNKPYDTEVDPLFIEVLVKK